MSAYYNAQWDPLLSQFGAMHPELVNPELRALRDSFQQEISGMYDSLGRMVHRWDNLQYTLEMATCQGNTAVYHARMEMENSQLKSRLERLENSITNPIIQIGERSALRPELVPLIAALRQELDDFSAERATAYQTARAPVPRPVPTPADAYTVPKTAYQPPAAEWSSPTTGPAQATGPTPLDRARTVVKDYFKGTAPPTNATARPSKRPTKLPGWYGRFRRVKYDDLDAHPAPPSWDAGLYDREQPGLIDHRQLWGHPLFNQRTVRVGSVPTNLSTLVLLKKLPGGYYILNITRSPGREQDDVFLTFLSTAEARNFTMSANRHLGVLQMPEMRSTTIEHYGQRSTPPERKLQVAIYDPNLKASRILLLHGVPMSLFHADELRRQLCEVFGNSLDVLLCPPTFDSDPHFRKIDLIFCNVASALVTWHAFQKKKADRDPLWRCVGISFKEDGNLPRLSIPGLFIAAGSGNDDDDDNMGPPFEYFPTPVDPGTGGKTRHQYYTERNIVAQAVLPRVSFASDDGLHGSSGRPLYPIQSLGIDDSDDEQDTQDEEDGTQEQTDGTHDEADSAQNAADVANMPTQEGVDGLGISLAAADDNETEEGEIRESNPVNNTNESESSDTVAANTTSSTNSSASAGPSTATQRRPSSEPTILIRGNLPVRPGDADAIAIARSMAKSRWAE